MTKVLVLYHSSHGHIEQLAAAEAQGAYVAEIATRLTVGSAVAANEIATVGI